MIGITDSNLCGFWKCEWKEGGCFDYGKGYGINVGFGVRFWGRKGRRGIGEVISCPIATSFSIQRFLRQNTPTTNTIAIFSLLSPFLGGRTSTITLSQTHSIPGHRICERNDSRSENFVEKSSSFNGLEYLTSAPSCHSLTQT